jgi:hypothetical protein
VFKFPHHENEGNMSHGTAVLAQCSRVLLENLTGSQLDKIFSTFYGT